MKKITLLMLLLATAAAGFGQIDRLLTLRRAKQGEPSPLIKAVRPRAMSARSTSDSSTTTANNNGLDVSSTPNFTLPNVFSGNNSTINYVPSINLIGGYSYVNPDTTAKLFSLKANFFTSGISQFTSRQQVFDSYLTPEASTWGLNVDATLGKSFGKKGTHTFGGRAQIDFLGKKLATFDSLSGKNANNASCMSTHIKLGLEYMPFADYLMVYINYDLIYALTNVDTFKSYFNLPNTKAHSFMDFGVRLPIQLASGPIAAGSGTTATTSFFVDVNFIPILGNMQQLYATDDKVIMSFKIGFVESIGVSPKIPAGP